MAVTNAAPVSAAGLRPHITVGDYLPRPKAKYDSGAVPKEFTNTTTTAHTHVEPPGAPADGDTPNEVPQSGWDADQAIAVMYRRYYVQLVREAALLVGDRCTAEDVVQDSFVAMHGAWRRLRDSNNALPYLRRSVINRSRSLMRHRIIVDRHARKLVRDVPGTEDGALTLAERSWVLSALRTLPPRQREVVVLRYYADMSEAEVAAAMSISKGAVKSHTSRAMGALRECLVAQKQGAFDHP
jgi:RNA polymerase sigma-70 factor (sigma-E family)